MEARIKRHWFEPHPRWGFQKCLHCPFDNDHPVHRRCGDA